MHRKRIVNDRVKLVVDRAQFTSIFDKIFEDKGGIDDAHILWEVERTQNIKCKYFVCATPINVDYSKYWDWCNSTLNGNAVCFSSNSEDNEEWWGFTDKEDIIIWMLRWS